MAFYCDINMDLYFHHYIKGI